MIADQAAALRRLVKEAGLPAPIEARASHGCGGKVVAVTSGKGGVGKTSVAVNLAVACARMGKRVTLVDFDLGLANVDVVMDLRPRSNLSHVVMGRMRLGDVAIEAEGVRVVPGASGLRELANLGAEAREELINGLAALEATSDLLVLDTGAGISDNVVRVAATADEALVVCTPEPTSILDAYATIKMIAREPNHAMVRLVVNMAESREEADRVSATVADVSRKFLGLTVDRLGFILKDEHVARAVRERRPFEVLYPKCEASAAVRGLGRMILNGRAANAEGREGFFRRMARALTGSRIAAHTQEA